MTVLAQLRWTELVEPAFPGCHSVLLVPVGATEQHGPHLPLGTDTDIAVALVARATAVLGGGAGCGLHRVVQAPAVAFGSSGEHQEFPGTLSIGLDATELLLTELGRSASRHFSDLILVSTHGGNRRPVGGAVSTLRDEGRRVAAWGPSWPGDAHAGRTETSVMLAIAPDRVVMPEASAGHGSPIDELLPILEAVGVRVVSPNGVLGDPTGATAQHGQRLLTEAVDELVALVKHRFLSPNPDEVGQRP